MPSNKEVVLKFFHAMWNERKLDLADELFSERSVTHQLRSGSPDATAPRSPAIIRAHLAEWLEAFPDMHFTVERAIEEGDLVSVACTAEGTHTRPWLGIAPTGRTISIRMAVTYRLEDHRIVEDWVLVDFLGVLQQLGVVAPMDELIRRR